MSVSTTTQQEQQHQAIQERLKAALWFQVGKIVDDETIKLGCNATPQFIGSLTELVWAQIGMFVSILCCDSNQFAQETLQSTLKHSHNMQVEVPSKSRMLCSWRDEMRVLKVYLKIEWSR